MDDLQRDGADLIVIDGDAREIADRLEAMPLARLLAEAERLTLDGHGAVVTWSRKVFIPLTKLCRDVCHYCTFAQAPLLHELLDLFFELGHEQRAPEAHPNTLVNLVRQ